VIRDFEMVVECEGEDALEDMALARAIEEGEGTEIVDEREVFELFEDLAAFEERQHEPDLAFEEVVSELRIRTPARASMPGLVRRNPLKGTQK
jgi:hypothetical protein